VRGADRPAFTLIELVGVVAILVLLAILSFPALQSAMEGAAASKCMQRQRQLYLALTSYAADNNGSLPPRSTANNPPAAGSTVWTQLMQSALKLTRADGKAMDCPANHREPYSPNAASFSPKQGYNALVGTSGLSAKLAQWSSAKVVLIADVAALTAAPNSRNNYFFEFTAATPSSASGIDPKSLWKMDFTLHRGRANLTFGDGHARAMLPEEVFAEAKAPSPTIFFRPQ
jgi:prepilin-type processing-associated H-X9-DG protein